MGDEGTKETFYGYPGDSTPDWYSSHGIGDHDNLLVGNYSVALTESERLARFGVTGKSTGQEFTFRGQTFRDDDTAPESDRRVDVFQPHHPPDIGGRAQEMAHEPTQEPGLYVPHTEEEYRQMYSEGIDHERPAEDEDPLTSFRRQFPEDNEVKDEDILSGMRQRLAPDMDPAQFAVLARSKNGRKAIEDEVNKGLTPYQRLRKQFPEAADKSEDDFLLPIYNKLGSVGKLDSRITSFADFKDLMNPQSGPVNAAYQFWKGASREASAVGHSESAKAWTALNPTTFSNLFYDAMDSVGNWVSPGANAGTQVKKWTQVADDWLDKNSYVNDYWRNFVGWMHDKAQDQNKQAQIDATRAQQAKGVLGSTGRVLGAAGAGTAAGIVTNLIPGAPIKSAVLAASAFEGLSRYGASVQANQDQRLIEGIQGAGMGAVYRYMWDAPNGRLLNGFTLWAADAGEDTLTKWLKGEKVDYQETAVRSALDIVSGVLMKGHQESVGKFVAPEEPSVTPEKVVETAPDPSTTAFAERFPGPYPNVFSRPGFVEELPERAEFAKRQDWHRYPKETERISRMYGELTYHASRSAVTEEVNKAVEARNNGDTEKAGEHLDRALSAMPPKARKQVAQKVAQVAHDAAKTKNGDSPADTQETKPERKETDKASEIINSHFYGLSPKRGESGAAANPFGGRQYRPGRHNKFAQEEPKEEELPPEVANDPLFLRLSPDERARYLKHLDSVKRSYPGNRGEAGFTLDWPGEIHDWFQEHWPKIEEKLKASRFTATFKPQASSPESEAMWTASKFRTSEAQQAVEAIPRQIARALEIDKTLRGGEKSNRREAVFNKFNDAQLKEVLASTEEGDVHTGNPAADWLMNKFYRTVFKALNQAEKGAGFEYKARDFYFYHAIKKERQAQFEKWFDKYLTNDPRWTKGRQLPTYRTLFEAGFQPVTLNPERLMQMRLFSSAQAIRKVMTLRDAAGLGGAVPKEGLDKDARAAFDTEEWTDIRAPNGEGYFVTKKAAQVVANAWEPSKLYRSYWHSPVWRTLGIIKGMGSRALLAFSLMHPKHIALIYPASVLVKFQRMALTGENRASAYQSALTDLMKLPTTGMRMLDAWRGKVDLTSPDEISDLQDLKTMGLDFGLSEERMMDFSKRLQELGPQWTRNAYTQAGAKLFDVGWKILTTEPVMRFFFGTVIPVQKLHAALQARDALFQARPELLKPENEKAMKTELAKLGDQIDVRFGEVNYSNVYWNKLAKDIGQMSLLSLGWQMGVFNFFGGAIHDMASNVAHIGELGKKLTGRPSEHTFLTDRILFTINYSAMSMLSNALAQYIFTGQLPQGQDYVFPRTRRNPKSADGWDRASPVEFTTEVFKWGRHIAQQGGGFLGSVMGTIDFARNKLNPFLSEVVEWFGNKNFFGQEIYSKLDDDGQKLQDSLKWAISQGLTPIPFQGLTVNTGQPFNWDTTIKSMLGYPKASQWASRSPTENLIEDTFHAEHPAGQTKEQEDLSQAHQALAAAVRDKDDQARIDAIKNLQKMGVSDKSITMTMEHAHSLQSDISKVHFKRLNPIAQGKILKRMTPEEQKVYLPLASKAARAQLQPPAQR